MLCLCVVMVCGGVWILFPSLLLSQVRLMPGADLVPNASSTLLSPPPLGSIFCPRPPPRVASEVGVAFRSVFQISRLAWPSTGDLDALGPYPSSFPDPGGTSAGSLLAAFSVASVETARESLASLADAERVDCLAVHRFSAQFHAWARNMPVFSSPEVIGRKLIFYLTSGTSAVDAAVSFQLTIVRAVLSVDRAARFDRVRL